MIKHETIEKNIGLMAFFMVRTGAKPIDGWKFAADILLAGDIAIGRIDYGGDSQRGWVRTQLNGVGCEAVHAYGDWSAVVGLQTSLIDASIKRLDIALTTFKGEVSDAIVVAAHASGQFTSGGRPPEMNSIVSSDPRAGKTRYIGSRKSHKMLRCYEKGFELIKDVPKSIRESITHLKRDDFTSDQVDQMYRVELELKDVDKVIAWEAITHRDSVFASAYPFCAELLPNLPVFRMLPVAEIKAQMTAIAAIENARRSYGRAFRALEVAGLSRLEIMDMVILPEPSPRMVAAGVLTLAF